MFDIQHDSPVAIHEQLAEQIRAHIASGALKPGARLAEYRALAQELLTNPQAVARAYAELEADKVLQRDPTGVMEVTAGAPVSCRLRLQDSARARLRQAIAQALAAGLAESEVLSAVEQQLAAAKAPPLSDEQAKQAIKEPKRAGSYRPSTAIQDPARQASAGAAEPEHPGGSEFRPGRG